MGQPTPQFCRLCYGYVKNKDNHIVVDEQPANIIKIICQEYLKGARLSTTCFPISNTFHMLFHHRYSFKSKTKRSGALIRNSEKTVCHHPPTILEPELISFICKTLSLADFDPETVHEKLDQILVYSKGSLDVQFKQLFDKMYSSKK